MILGLEDIPGGTTFIAFAVWLVLTGLYYLVCYLAALNVLDDITRNSWLKIPAMICAAFPAASLMAVFHYKPFVFTILISIANYFRLQKKFKGLDPKWDGIAINIPLFYLASYTYIALLTALALYFPKLGLGQ